MKKLVLTLLTVSILLFAGCKKDEETDNKEDLLTAKSWIMIGYTENGQDVLQEMYDDCELDNITTFLSNGVFKEDEGATKCFEDDPQVEEGTWKINGNNLIMTGDILLALNFTITELNATTLKLSGKNPFTSETISITFTAQ